MNDSFRGSPRRRLLLQPIALAAIAVFASLGWPVGASADDDDDVARKVYGYEAAATSRFLEYDINQSTSTTTFTDQCIPNPGPSNGRGIAFDPEGGDDGDDGDNGDNGDRQEGILFNTFLAVVAGNGRIFRNDPPTNGQCPSRGSIPFGEGPGPPNQDDISALDLDPDDESDVLYVAGYLPTAPTGFGTGTSQILYEVDKDSGRILGRCRAERGGGNDTLTVATLRGRAAGGARGRKVLLTDFGEFRPLVFPNTLAAVDVRSLTGPPAPAPAPPCRILQEFPNPIANAPNGVITGADYELIPQPGGTRPRRSLVANGVLFPEAIQFYDADGPPFATGRSMGSTFFPSITIEDNTLDVVGGEGDD
jgi:hypothetical protein